jgi:endonuclease YncB( thermonuclease family)
MIALAKANSRSRIAPESFFFVLCWIALWFCSGLVLAGTLQGKVVGISDGDTVTVLDSAKVQHRIRLGGIDAPEKAQPFGQKSKENLSRLVSGKLVVVETGKIDRYGRAIGKISIDGVDANLEQIKAGMAWHYKQYSNEQSATDRLAYARAEVRARQVKVGLWKDTTPMSPWDWRHGGKGFDRNVSLVSECPCAGGARCTGPRGGLYCINPNGKKKY